MLQVLIVQVWKRERVLKKKAAKGIGNVQPSTGVGAEEIQNPRLPNALTR